MQIYVYSLELTSQLIYFNTFVTYVINVFVNNYLLLKIRMPAPNMLYTVICKPCRRRNTRLTNAAYSYP